MLTTQKLFDMIFRVTDAYNRNFDYMSVGCIANVTVYIALPIAIEMSLAAVWDVFVAGTISTSSCS